jgi:hypothetical protein
MRFKKLFEALQNIESIFNEIRSYNGSRESFEKIANWFKTVNVSKKDKIGIKWITGIINKSEIYYPDKETFQNMFRDVELNDLKKLLPKKENLKIETANAIYINDSFISENKFKDYVDEIEKLLNSLKGFHRKALKPKLHIKFIPKNILKVKAKYKANIGNTIEDELWISSSVIPGNEYASLSYIIVHELGHRYLNYNRVNFNYNSREWSTTRYSMTSYVTEEEPFAELFALSHFKYKGKPFDDYKETIDKFIKLMS